jgi:hypothetical protein
MNLSRIGVSTCAVLLLACPASAGGGPAKKALRAVEEAIDEAKDADKSCRKAVLEDLEDAADRLEGERARPEKALRALRDAIKAAGDDCPKKVQAAIRDALDELEDAEDGGSGGGELLLDETFDDNRNAWWVGVTDQAEAGIQDGRLWLRHHVAGGYATWMSKPVRSRGDYRLELTLRIHQNLDNYGCGLWFGSSDANNGYTFEVTDGGQYRLSYFEGGQWRDLTGWQAHKAVQAGGVQWITIGLARQGRTWRLQANGQTLDRVPARELFGGNIGMHMEARMTCDFDRLRVWGD